MDTNSSFDICWTLPQEILQQVRYNLLDSLSLVKILEKEQFDSDCYLFTVDFKSLYTNIPVQHAIELMKELVNEYRNVISNADFVIDLLELVLDNSLLEFHGEYFQQIFGIIMGTNVAPILGWKKY